ncbi:hypothetical protein HMF8227_02353 [Saliniradius amylolyticus]|uniref:Uncharacterized protein n=1 Tax=Saliniradius amylolyticus TaxID=2183582 RepID=A0A2S2E574_9ALTE|nr:hypothetical protein [Saliniradius amylolyticus]AWL12805.1 hypothetical protein HMF8227_02353 [Saliniradius amylolyticus]
MNQFTYIYAGQTHTDTSAEYMQQLGMSAETIESVLQQQSYERRAALGINANDSGDALKTALKAAIDTAAGSVRKAYVSQGQLVEEEYHLAKQHAEGWDGSGDAPATVQAWADASGLSTAEAKDDILATATAWEQALTAIRAARLSGKAAVSGATDDDEALNAAETAIAQLNALMPQ